MSQKKNYCKICRVWTGGHKQQIIKHEEGRAHIENKERGITDARERAKLKGQDEDSVADQLAEIERKAAAMAADPFACPGAPSAVGQQNRGAGGGGGGGAASAGADAQRLAQAAEKRKIEETIAEAKRPKIAEDPVAAAWTKHVDPNSKVNYYYNSLTKESSWTVPAGYVEPTTTLSSSTSPWTSGTDPTSGHTYYYNSITKESRWERPPDFDTPTAVAPPVATPAPAAAVAPVPAAVTASPVADAQPGELGIWARKAPAAIGPADAPVATGDSPWVVVTDPNSGHIYYFNKTTQTSVWEKPPDLAVDVTRPPPPPAGKPPPPPRKPLDLPGGSEAGIIGEWEEVTTTQSQWTAGTILAKAPNEPDSDEEYEAKSDAIAMKHLVSQRGAWMDEDYERHAKEVIDKKSSSGVAGEKLSFSMNKATADGKKVNKSNIRKRDDAEEDARCV